MRDPGSYFNLSDDFVRRIFRRAVDVWDILSQLPELVDELTGGRQVIKGTVMHGAELGSEPIYLGAGAVIEPGSYVTGPAYIGEGARIRHGAYVRANCVMLGGSLVGHASEVKNALLLPEAKAPHFAYVGDSVLGHRVNLGAGTKLSNLPITTSTSPTVRFDISGENVDTGLRKMGAILGDGVQVGCNAVFNPGALLGPHCIVYAGTVVRKGFHEKNTIIKLRQSHEFGVLDVR